MSLSKRDQAQALGSVLEGQRPEVQDPLVQGPPESGVRISKPTREGGFDSYQVTVKGHTLPVRMPKMDPPSTSQNGSVYGERTNHTIDEVARALSQLPPETLSVLTRVELSATRNPSDDYWAQEYNTPDFTSYMTCGEEGLVTIYPQTYPLGTEDIAETLIHEAGHAWSFQQWGNDPEAKAWSPWKAAAEKDGISISNYATNSPTEDVSETSAVYLATRGTPEHERFRQAFPARFAVLDQVFAGMKAAG